jgi:cytochrome c oxidase subunit 2
MDRSRAHPPAPMTASIRVVALTMAVMVALTLAFTGAALAADAGTDMGSQEALRTVGPQASHILDLWRLALWMCTAVFAAILVAFAWAIRRSPRAHADTPPDASAGRRGEPGARRGVALATGVSAVLLLVLIAASVATDRALAHLPLRDALHIEVTANQWWWEFRYDDPDPSRVFTTANEMHVPVGRPVILTLKSGDVIHSFWVPNVHGKKDLIPGRTTTHQFRVDREGTYRGQCAEFCGVQHAWMAMLLVAEPRERYEAWAEQQRRPQPPPTDPQLARGYRVFMGSTCAMCHAVVGTEAGGKRAPDLTHVGSRTTLAAGRLANDPEALAAWITDPQPHKPGVNMPAHRFSPDELAALVAYLRSLK